MTNQRIAEHIDIEWLDRPGPETVCPCCGYSGPVRQYVDIDYHPPEARHRFILQICPSCSVRFVDNTHMMDYFSDILIEIGWHTYQIQLGAGVWPISAPLTRVAKPKGAKVLEIGGAYGFGLDFCIRARGWAGEGFDPSPLAAFGARELGISVTQDYFEEKDLSRGPYDVIIATEVIEHLEHPPEFLALMRRALAADGILVLSTPDAAWITPALPAAQLMPLLSPGAHVVLQTAESLEKALRAAGFVDIKIKAGSLSLVAYASPSPFTLNEDEAAGRALYRHYLVERGKLTDERSDLRLGFAGRGYFEACNDGDLRAAEAAWAALVPAVRARFGLELETLTALPSGAENCGLAELCELMPIGLGMILFARAMYLLARKTRRATLLPLFTLAKQACAALLTALAKRSLIDGLTASLAEVIELEIALCLAETGDPASLSILLALATGHWAEQRGWRGFNGLVNAGALELAAQLKTSLGLDMPSPDVPADLRRDSLLSLANFALAPSGDTLAAITYAQALRGMGHEDAAGTIMLQAFTRLVNAARYEEAEGVMAAEKNLFSGLAQAPGQVAEDARLGDILLDLQRNRMAQACRKILGLEARSGERPQLTTLYVDGFVRLVNAAQYDAAREIAANRKVDRRLPACAQPLRHDALAALLMLELQPSGNHTRIPQLLEECLTAGLETTRFNALALAAFVTLVNDSDFDTARLLRHVVDPILLKLRPPYEDAAQNALFAAGMLALQTKEDLRRAVSSFARLRDDIVKRLPEGGDPGALFWPAMRGEVLALHRLDRTAEASALLQNFVTFYAGAPDDLRAQLGEIV
jgi:SAM-dependent methyltransferase